MIHNTQLLSLYGLGSAVNGDNVVGLMSPESKVIPEGFVDDAHTHLFKIREDRKNPSHKKYLGLIELMSTSKIIQKTFGADLLKSDAVLELNDSTQKVAYDIAIPSDACDNFKVLQDSHLQNGNEPLGVDGTPFYVYFDKAPTTGDVFKFDLQSHYQTRVSSEIGSVSQEGDKYKVVMIYESNSHKKDFPKDGLRAGATWVKVAHPMAEYEEQWSTVTGLGAEPGYISMEWRLGSPHGVEVAWTMEGGNTRTLGATQIANQLANKYEEFMSRIGGQKKSLFVSGQTTKNGGFVPTAISNTLEIMAVAEAYKMEATSNMFATAQTITDSVNGTTARINEGAWLQARRGKIIKYSRPNALTVNQLIEASQYYFQNSDLPINGRHITFVGGEMATKRVQEIINQYAIQVLNTTPMPIVGTDSVVANKGLITGTLDNLRLNQPNFGEVLIPGLGWAKVEHDPAFDWKGFETGVTQRDGFHGLGGFNTLSYSLMVKGMDRVANNVNRVKNATLVEEGTRTSNLYYVKPTEHVCWGRTQGRMNNGSQYSNIVSSLRHRGQEFWISVESGMLMMDTTRQVIIEMDNTFTR